ncbi:MAG: MFS transporter [Deferribacterales bacterium]
MNDRRLLYIITFASVLTFSSLYAPQPIQPLIAREFGLTMSEVSLLTTASMIPLAVAPIFYGYLLEAVCARTVLVASLSVLALCQFMFYFSDNYYLLVFIRVMLGCAMPAVLTGIMTYISDTSAKTDIQKNLAIYISSTIFGGFSGRFFSGLLSHYFGWRMMFLILGFSLLTAALLMRRLPSNKASITKINPQAAKEVLTADIFPAVYLMVFFMFFMFAAVLNFIPFRMRQISPDSGEMLIGVMYTGYIMGIVVALNIMKIIRVLRSEQNTIFAGLTLFTGSLLLFTSDSIGVMFFGMFVFCSGMFMAHSTAAGYVNKIADKHKGVTNGLYVAFYYAGGALGSVLPGLIYQSSGWNAFLTVLGIIMSSALVAGRLMLRR